MKKVATILVLLALLSCTDQSGAPGERELNFYIDSQKISEPEPAKNKEVIPPKIVKSPINGVLKTD